MFMYYELTSELRLPLSEVFLGIQNVNKFLIKLNRY
jgi:hypothetical protein